MITADLAVVLGKVCRPGDFFAAGTTELLAPLLEVEGVGPVALPLLPMQARELIGVADPAPYGRGEQTVIDPTVRRCWQIGPDRVRIRGRHWPRTLETIWSALQRGSASTPRSQLSSTSCSSMRREASSSTIAIPRRRLACSRPS